MIKIKIQKNKQSENISYFKISGHANAGDYGQDIVCAAVSAVSQMTLNGLIEILNLKKIKYEINDGLIICNLADSNLTREEYEKVNILINSMFVYLKAIEENYPKNVKMIIEEV